MENNFCCNEVNNLHQKKYTKKSFVVLLLSIFIVLLPIDSALPGFFNISLINIFPLLFVVFSLIAFYDKIYIRITHKHEIFLFLFLIYDLLTIIWSKDVFYSSNIMFAIYFLFFIMFYFYDFNKNEKRMLYTSFYVSIFLLILTTIFFGRFYHGRLTLSINENIDPNYFCSGFVLIVAFLLNRLKFKKERLINIILLFAVLLIVVLSGSRGSLLAIIGEIFVFFAFRYKKNIFAIILIAVSLLLLYLLFLKVLPENLSNRFNIIESFYDGGSGRTTIWKNMISIYNNGNLFDKIFGFGRESTRYLYMEKVGIYYSPHNLYIKILLENGIIGITFFSLFIISTLCYTWRKNLRMQFCLIIGTCMAFAFLDMDNTRVFWVFLVIASSDIFKRKMIGYGRKNKHNSSLL